MKEEIHDSKKIGRTAAKVSKLLGTAMLALVLMLNLPNVSFAIGKGAQGPDVYVIQGMLKSLGSYSGPMDGHYNDLTVRGVKYDQKKHGLPITGAVDPRTFNSVVYTYHSKKAMQMKAKSKGRINGKGFKMRGNGVSTGIGAGRGAGAGRGKDAGQGGGAGQGEGAGHGGGAGQSGGQGQGGGMDQGGTQEKGNIEKNGGGQGQGGMQEKAAIRAKERIKVRAAEKARTTRKFNANSRKIHFGFSGCFFAAEAASLQATAAAKYTECGRSLLIRLILATATSSNSQVRSIASSS